MKDLDIIYSERAEGSNLDQFIVVYQEDSLFSRKIKLIQRKLIIGIHMNFTILTYRRMKNRLVDGLCDLNELIN
jgi:hypothetical protein